MGSYEEYAEFEASKNTPKKAKHMLDVQYYRRPEKPEAPTIYTSANGRQFTIIDGVTRYLDDETD